MAGLRSQQAPPLPGRSQQAPPLLGRTKREVEDLCEGLGFTRANGRKLFREVCSRGPRELEEMRGIIGKPLRAKLDEVGAGIGRTTRVLHESDSSDGSKKLLVGLSDGRAVETVALPAGPETHARAPSARLTACVSSQAGCPLACTFCATGQEGFGRSLRAQEIVDQVLHIQERMGRRVTHVVAMGMGEPLLAMTSFARAHEAFAEGMGIKRRKVTLSTVGVPGRIRKLARMRLKLTLTVSLHAPNQEIRERIIPSARSHPLDALFQECRDFHDLDGRPPCFEYTLLGGVNDSLDHAEELARRLHSEALPYHVNLIPWNPVDSANFEPPASRDHVRAFQRVLRQYGIPATIRKSLGGDEAAACGQLRNEAQREPCL